jgi:hypothetical protein
MLQIDHVVYAVRDLDVAAERFRRDLGLDSAVGGRHSGWGTGNRIVPLGETYVELISVVDAEEAERTSFGRSMLAFLEGGDRPWAFVCRTDDLDAIAGRLGLPVEEGSRTRPDGRVIAWRGAGLDDPRRDASLPFFIQWRLEADDLYPGRMRAAHGVQAGGLAWIEVGGDAGRLADWLGGADLPVRVVDGAPAVRSFGVATAGGELVVT